jgi:hypothetical protein
LPAQLDRRRRDEPQETVRRRDYQRNARVTRDVPCLLEVPPPPPTTSALAALPVRSGEPSEERKSCLSVRSALDQREFMIEYLNHPIPLEEASLRGC